MPQIRLVSPASVPRALGRRRPRVTDSWRGNPHNAPLHVAGILSLQRRAGNAATSALIAQRKEGAKVRTLRIGTDGDDVRDLQSSINAVDEVELALAVDRIFGPLTDRAVRQFQGAHPPLVVDGAVGALTRSALTEAKGEPQAAAALAKKVFDRGSTAFNAGDFAHAFDFFTRANELAPRIAFVFDQAQSLRRLGGRRAEAIALFEQYLADGTGQRNAEAVGFIAELKGPGKSGDDDVDVKTAGGLFQKAAALFNAGKFAPAFDAFTQADEASHRVGLTFDRAQSLRRLGGRREEAIALYEAYLAEGGGGRTIEAATFIAELKGPGKSGDDDTDVANAKKLFVKGSALFSAGKFALAFDAFTQADEASHRPGLTFDRAQSLRKLGGRRDKSIALYDQYLVEAPDGNRADDSQFFRNELQSQGAAP